MLWAEGQSQVLSLNKLKTATVVYTSQAGLVT